MTENKGKTGAPIWGAMDAPIECFMLLKDCRRWKKNSQDRKTLYLAITKSGWTAWPDIKTLMERTGFSRSTVYALLADLKELGLITDATDDKGRKYHGENGHRVRAVHNDALPKKPYPGWIWCEKAQLMIRWDGAGVSDSPETATEQESELREKVKAGVRDTKAGVRVTSIRSPSYEGENDATDAAQKSCAHERTRKNLNTKNNPHLKEQADGGGSFTEEQGSIGDALQEMRQALEKFPLPDSIRHGLGKHDVQEQIAEAIEQHGFERLVLAWSLFVEFRTFTGLRMTVWELFATESDEWLYKADARLSERSRPNYELTPAEREEMRLSHVAMYGDLDLPYYTEKLREAKAEYEANGKLFDEETQQQMREDIADYEAKVAELTGQENRA